jgi:hypothetical protein
MQIGGVHVTPAAVQITWHQDDRKRWTLGAKEERYQDPRYRTVVLDAGHTHMFASAVQGMFPFSINIRLSSSLCTKVFSGGDCGPWLRWPEIELLQAPDFLFDLF